MYCQLGLHGKYFENFKKNIGNLVVSQNCLPMHGSNPKKGRYKVISSSIIPITSGPSLWKQTMDKLGANFRGIEGKMQSLLKKDEKEDISETSSLKFENNKRNDQIVQVHNHQQSAPSDNMNQNYDLEEEYRNLRPQRFFVRLKK